MFGVCHLSDITVVCEECETHVHIYIVAFLFKRIRSEAFWHDASVEQLSQS